MEGNDFGLMYFPEEEKKSIGDATMHKIYRISDGKKEVTHIESISKLKCLSNFTKHLGAENTTFILDNCSFGTKRIIEALEQPIIETDLGNAGTLKKAFELALELPPNDIIYFVEDDFLHTAGAEGLIKEALEKVDYVTLYDHSDKYVTGVNPYVTELGEKTAVFLTEHSHWKLTNSTVQTFATRVKTLREDKDILWKYNFNGPVPDSFRTFIELGQKGRLLASPIPGRATHCHPLWLTPFVDWVSVAEGERHGK